MIWGYPYFRKPPYWQRIKSISANRVASVIKHRQVRRHSRKYCSRKTGFLSRLNHYHHLISTKWKNILHEIDSKWSTCTGVLTTAMNLYISLFGNCPERPAVPVPSIPNQRNSSSKVTNETAKAVWSTNSSFQSSMSIPSHFFCKKLIVGRLVFLLWRL